MKSRGMVIFMEDKLQELPHEIEVCLKEGNVEECKKLFLGCDPNAVRWSGSYNIFSLMPMPREFAFWVKEQGADINFRDAYGRTPIFEIARRDGDIALMIELGADINAVDMDGCTPLHIAAARGCKKAVRTLIKAGAKIDAQTKDYNGYRHFTPLEKVLYEPSLSSIKKYDICKILLKYGAEMTERSRKFVSAFSEVFYRHNSGKKESKSLQNQKAALENLCKLFDAEMLCASAFHDGVSPIIVTDFLGYTGHFEELWKFLVPERGRAQTAQGEVIRIAGRISHELMDNGGMNWDEDYQNMLYTFLEYFRCGNPFSDEWLDEIRDALKDGDVNDKMIYNLRISAVYWVRENPEAMPLLEGAYTR